MGGRACVLGHQATQSTGRSHQLLCEKTTGNETRQDSGAREDLGHRLASDAVWGAPGNTVPYPRPPACGSQSVTGPGEVSRKYVIISVNKPPALKTNPKPLADRVSVEKETPRGRSGTAKPASEAGPGVLPTPAQQRARPAGWEPRHRVLSLQPPRGSPVRAGVRVRATLERNPAFGPLPDTTGRYGPSPGRPQQGQALGHGSPAPACWGRQWLPGLVLLPRKDLVELP